MLLIGMSHLFFSTAFGADAASQDFFEKRVRPLLVERCEECHGAEKHKGGLRLDSKQGWITGGDSGPPITPGKPEISLLTKAIHYLDRDLKMPPKAKLSDSDIAVLEHWIAAGAYDPRESKETAAAKPKTRTIDIAAGRQWWSFQPIKRNSLPSIKDKAWPRNDIDRFVLAKLEAANLQPAAAASPKVLERRLVYDLAGGPVADFGDSKAGSDIAGYVNRLLASKAFAERWSQHWLDAARFAESSGGGRTLPFKDAWRYRDYVIESMRDDVPLNTFIREQMAGDLMPYSTAAQRRRQLTATGFLALGATNYEEQDKELLRMDIVDEQLDTIGKSLLAMTIGCARCHDHKFDPIPTHDYYALAGILRSTKSIRNPKDNVAHWIDTPLPLDGAEETKMQRHEANLMKLTSQLELAKKQLKKLAPPLEPKDAKGRPVSPDELPGIVVDDVQAKRVGDWKSSTKYSSFVGEGYLHDMNQGKGTKTLTFVPKIEKSGRYEVRLAYMALKDRSEKVPVHILHADGEDEVSVDQTVIPPVGGRFVILGQYRFEAGGQGFVMVSNVGTTGYVTADAVEFIPVEDLANLVDEKDKSISHDPKVAAAQNQVKKLEAELKALEKSLPARPEVMSVAEHEDRSDCPVHIRGSIRNLGEKVPRGFLQVASWTQALPIPTDQSGRLQLAEWIVSPQNPLTARVLANRVWMQLFGEGLVRTPDNFGTTGEKPSHPELLDHLAAKLIDEQWSLKALLRYIVQSKTYQMASRAADEKAAMSDPENRLLAHQNRRRLDANALRDTILLTAGTMNETFLGPTLKSDHKVKDNDETALNTEYNWIFDDTRRSIYTPAFRNKRMELFEAFDFADVNTPIAKRNTSTVAPQALYLLNHDFVIEQSRAAATRLLANRTLGNDAERLEAAYNATLGRKPSTHETQIALDFVALSEAEPEAKLRRTENWAMLFQSLFGCVDFRYLE
jgi:Protein of unknown function (DUF1553)/Protein of unknown function (DUF1549)/Planctomycete cytochrome C